MWAFSKTASEIPVSFPNDWQKVDLPHTWNGKDGQDGGNDYFRGKCFYAKSISKDEIGDSPVNYIQFDGVNSSACVYWNGEKIAEHNGGYSAFRAVLNNIKENNLLVVSADNSENDFVYPQTADFTFYGGIYRGVSIIGVDDNHFDLDYYGAPGLKITPVVKGTKAEVEMQAYAQGEVEFTVKSGNEIIASAKASGKNPACKVIIENVRLWNGIKDPFLYSASAKLIVNGKAADEVSCKFGCRSFEFDPDKGFILNGNEYPLRGVSRHQDRPNIGYALKYEHHKEDIDLICEMGANTVRLAHYQHSQDFYNLCDEKGLIVWAEIPYISRHMPKGVDNTVSQMTELICQNYNHPCIVTWGVSNEITMGGAADESMLENHRTLNDLVHKTDKTRPTTMAVVTMCSMDEEIVHITDIVSYNHYFGWYGGNVSMYGPWFDNFHKKYPKKAIGISEYGCEALNWHTSNPQQGDYTEEYQAYYHEELIKQISQRPYLWATHVWNMFDFAADARAEGGENGMNHKGLVSFDRKYKKDSFYAYKAWLSDEPFVHICSKRYVDRVEDETKVTVYSNQPEVELFVNGESVEVQKKGEYPFFFFKVKNSGESKLLAKAGEYTDESIIIKVDKVNEDYIMKDANSVINWFEIETPPGYLSINDTIEDVLSTFKGKICALRIMLMLKNAFTGNSSSEDKKKKSGGISVMGFKINKQMIDMAKGFSVKRVFMMLSDKFSKEDILKVNSMLNKIRKKAK
ncbi:MAG: glycoside hydrolase family 2 protein [Clostridiales bacterium]|nr:glycoside hydrolase family 2 protein [Clostridiales bacterium]